ncbi:MAG TPA: hypothetical protein VGH91_03125 [Gammaproteobacteria bacterium]
MRISVPALLTVSLLFAACGKSPQNPVPTPAASTAPVPAASTAAAFTAPAATSAVAAVTSEAATVSTTPAPEAVTTTGPEIAGSVALAQGSVTDTAKDGSSRPLKDGDYVYPGDSFVLGADSYLDLDLEDTGRILLRPNTTFQIQSYHYDADAHDASGPTDANGQPLIKPASAQPENAFFKLIKGGLRAVDGVIGKTSPQNYGVETPVATIGVRGTAFDARYCGDDCADEADASGAPENGLYTSVSEGSIGVKNDGGETVQPAGQSGYVKSRKERAQALATLPKALRHMDLPDKLKARAQQNRNNIQVRRQKRRQMVVQKRQAEQKASGKPSASEKGAKPETPMERRQQRREQLQEQRKGGAAPAADQGRPGAAEKGTKSETPMERRQQRREQLQQQRKGEATPANTQLNTAAGERNAREQMKEKRQQRREERQQQANPSAAAPQDKQPPAKGDGKECKGKKKRRKNGKCEDGG